MVIESHHECLESSMIRDPQNLSGLANASIVEG